MRLLLILAAFSVQMCVQASDDDCIAIDGQSGIDACLIQARSIQTSAQSLLLFARKLEQAGLTAKALAVYTLASEAYPRKRPFLKGVIRLRREAKALALTSADTQQEVAYDAPIKSGYSSASLIVDTPVIGSTESQAVDLPSPPPANWEKQCYKERWQQALGACETAVGQDPSNAPLVERYADVLRSTGQTQLALTYYKSAQDLYLRGVSDNSADHAADQSAGNSRVKRKIHALVQLLGPLTQQAPMVAGASLELPADSSNHLAIPTQRIVSVPAGDSINAAKAPPLVSKLQLLKDLLARGLIDAQEYERKRVVLLDEAFGDEGQSEALAVGANSTGTYRALIVGNDRYESFARLRSPVNDARVVEAVLRNRYGFETQTLINATRYEILSALSQLRKLVGENDSLLIYYAGHGYLDEQTNRGYWLPIDAERENIANWIPTTDITDTLAGLAARHALVVADSCFSGSLLRAGDAALPEARADLLRRLANKKSRTVMTSGGLEPVLDDGDGKHSVFARVFLDALRDNQGVLEAGRLFLQVRDRVTANADQTPQYAPIRNAGHQGGDFIFVRQ